MGSSGIKLNSKIWQTIVLSHSPREEESMLFEEKKDIAQSKQAMDSKHNHPHAQMDNAKKKKKKQTKDENETKSGFDFSKFKFGKKKKDKEEMKSDQQANE